MKKKIAALALVVAGQACSSDDSLTVQSPEQAAGASGSPVVHHEGASGNAGTSDPASGGGGAGSTSNADSGSAIGESDASTTDGATDMTPKTALLGGGNPGSMGLDRHDFLYCGEWQTERPGEHIFIVRGGKVVWTHDVGDNDELGDCTMMSNGHIVFSLRSHGAQEIVPDLVTGKDGQIVWDYKQEAGETHAAQPIALHKVLVMTNGTATVNAKLQIFDTSAADGKAGTILKTFPFAKTGGTHGQFRHVRMLANGHFLIPHMSENIVREYDTDGTTVLWELKVDSNPCEAVRLKNGNTMVSGNGAGWVREYGPDKQIVWQASRSDAGLTFATVQECTRLANGNTLVNNWAPGPASNDPVQLFELSADKKIVWKVQDHVTLSNASSTQLLDEPGTPENPGEQQR